MVKPLKCIIFKILKFRFFFFFWGKIFAVGILDVLFYVVSKKTSELFNLVYLRNKDKGHIIKLIYYHTITYENSKSTFNWLHQLSR